jgi:hypothetical protein
MKLFPPSFRAGAALLSEKIDALAQAAAAILNGGLDADNLAAGLQLPLDYFAEQRGFIILRAVFNSSGSGESDTQRLAYAPMPLRLVGWGIAAMRTFPDGHFNPSLEVINAGLVVAQVTPATSPPAFQAWGTFDTQPVFAAGDVVHVRLVGAGLLSPEWGYLDASVSLLFDTPHGA